MVREVVAQVEAMDIFLLASKISIYNFNYTLRKNAIDSIKVYITGCH